jgi:hypothetical protein
MSTRAMSGRSPATRPTSATVAQRSYKIEAHALSADTGSREAVAELLAGMTDVLAAEADAADDEDVSMLLTYLLVDVLDAWDWVKS